MIQPLKVHGSTHLGLIHEINEDAHAIIPTEEEGVILLVCDGMGGMGRGDQASALAVRLLTEELRLGGGYPPQRMRTALRRADIALREELCSDPNGKHPGSTAVMAYVLDNAAHVAWVGDSRAYLIRGGEVLERTTDHKLINELIAAGKLTEEDARDSHLAHIVTRALGGRSTEERPVSGATMGHPWKLHRDDILLLCSDGLCDLVEDEELARVVSERAPAEATEALIQMALERGGHDNITCIVARWEGPDYAEDDTATPLIQMREEQPEGLDAPTYQDAVDTLDERPGAERPTEEIGFDELPWKQSADPEATPPIPELRPAPMDDEDAPSPAPPQATPAPPPATTSSASPVADETPAPVPLRQAAAPRQTATPAQPWQVAAGAFGLLLLAALYMVFGR